jgi:hypothetical protein
VKLAYSVRELQEVLGVGRATARRIAEELGIRVSPRRILVPAVRLERWLEGHSGSGPLEEYRVGRESS